MLNLNLTKIAFAQDRREFAYQCRIQFRGFLRHCRLTPFFRQVDGGVDSEAIAKRPEARH